MLYPVQEQIVSPFMEVASYTECDMQSKKKNASLIFYDLKFQFHVFHISRQDVDIFSV